MDLNGQVALVTGAAQGIGRGITEGLAAAGARVIMTDINEPQGRAAAKTIGATFHQQDIANANDWRELIAAIAASHGALPILVNNARIEGDPAVPKDPEQAPLDDWHRIFAVNAAGAFLVRKHAIPLLTRSGGGAIINLSSVASLRLMPFITAYGAAKAAVEHLSRTIALHCAKSGYRIRYNSVHPGQVRTPTLEKGFARFAAAAGATPEQFMAGCQETVPLGAFQEPADIAHAVVFLASDDARYITGQAIAVDGGFTLAH